MGSEHRLKGHIKNNLQSLAQRALGGFNYSWIRYSIRHVYIIFNKNLLYVIICCMIISKKNKNELGGVGNGREKEKDL
jgi:hypothetical protein